MCVVVCMVYECVCGVCVCARARVYVCVCCLYMPGSRFFHSFFVVNLMLVLGPDDYLVFAFERLYSTEGHLTPMWHTSPPVTSTSLFTLLDTVQSRASKTKSGQLIRDSSECFHFTYCYTSDTSISKQAVCTDYVRRTPWLKNCPHVHLQFRNSFDFWTTSIKCHDFIKMYFSTFWQEMMVKW